MAVAQFASLFGALLLIQGLTLALTPHRTPGIGAISPGWTLLLGAIEGGLGFAILAGRLLHVRRLRVNLPLYWLSAFIWLPVGLAVIRPTPLLGVLIMGVVVGALTAPIVIARTKPGMGRPGLDLGELVCASVVVLQGALLLIPYEYMLATVPPPFPPVLGLLGIGSGVLLVAARPLRFPGWARTLAAIAVALFELPIFVTLSTAGVWGAAMIALGVLVLPLVSGSRSSLPNFARSTSMANRAAVLVGLLAGIPSFAVALLAALLLGIAQHGVPDPMVVAGLDILLLSVVVISGAAAIVATVYSKHISHELRVFGEALATIAAGRYEEPLPRQRGDERDLVIAAFEAMRIQVRTQLSALGRNSQRLTELHGSTLALSGHTDEQPLAELALVELSSLIEANSAIVMLREPGLADLRDVAHSGATAQIEEEVARRSTALARASTGAVVTAEGQVLLVPLHAGPQEYVGLLGVGRSDAQPPFSQEDAALVELFAATLAHAVLTARLFKQLGQLESQREAERMKAEFLASVSHELRTPLTLVHGYAELMRDRPFSPEQVKRVAGEVFNASGALVRMVDDLLDFSRLEAGQYRLQQRPIHLPEVVNEAVGLFRHQLSHRVVLIEHAENLPEVHVDADRVRQAVANLVSNAIKYGPEGSTIRVRTRVADGFAEVAVQDEGAGVPIEEQAHLYERFYRGTSHRTSTIRGVGLGLSVVRAIMEGHDGEVGMENAPSMGSIFWLRFPLAAPAGADEPERQALSIPTTAPVRTERFADGELPSIPAA